MLESAAEKQAQANSKSLPILMVDPAPLIIATATDVLRREGFAVEGTTRPSEALGRARIAACALAIFDYPLFAGEGAAYAAEWARLGVPLLFTSTDANSELVRRAIDAGAAGYYLKPFDPLQLGPAVYVTLRRHQERLALATEADRLRGIVDENSEVGVAVGLLMAQRSLPRRAAFETLRQHARRTRRRLGAVASEIAAMVTSVNDVQTAALTKDEPRRTAAPRR